MKILSTPTAKAKNGTTSAIIRVIGTLQYENIPNDIITEKKTIITPLNPTVSWSSICVDIMMTSKVYMVFILINIFYMQSVDDKRGYPFFKVLIMNLVHEN